MTADAAAALLGTNARILSLWEERFGYPVPERLADGQWLYPDETMIALRDALGRASSIASAITEARRMQSIRSKRRGQDKTRLPSSPDEPEEAA
jgi:DNA-binding transcriptional MerR regulator